MDIATLIGVIAGVILITVAMSLGGGLGGFIDIPSILIVIGGTFAATLINFPLKQFLNTLKVGVKLLFAKEEDPLEIISRYIQLAVLVRKEGQLALEEASTTIEHPFMRKGLLLVADGVDAEALNGILRLQNVTVQQRHKIPQEVLKAGGRWAPAFGMIGTLIGLVSMLGSMDDPSQIGPKMAIALLTTMYGALIANLFCLPMAGKLKQRTEQEVLINTIIAEGLQGLQMGLNPRLLEEKLKAFLPTAQQEQELGTEH